MRKLMMRMPTSMEGMFKIVATDEWPRKITGVRLHPDAAIDEMKKLYELAELPTRNVSHDGYMSPQYGITDVATLLKAPPAPMPKRDVKSYGHLVHVNGASIAAPEYYGEPYVGSYLLDTAENVPDLPFAEVNLLKRLGANIPEGVHDCFTVDILRREDGTLFVQSLAVSPNVFQKVMGEGFMAPLAEGKPEGSLGVRHHHRTMELNRDQLDAIDGKLEAVGRKRA